MNFTHYDKESPTWHKLKAHYTERLARLRELNDGTMDEADRNIHLGRIREVKEVLLLDADLVEVPEVSQETI